MTNLGDAFYYLGMPVNHFIDKKINFCQSTYLREVLDYFKITECKPATILIDSGVANSLLLYYRYIDKKSII